MGSLNFPASLKPIVSKGYSYSRGGNIYRNTVQGGIPRQGRDTYFEPVPIEVNLVTSALGNQVFQSFLNNIHGGADSFNMTLDSGLGLQVHQVLITSDIGINTNDGINWNINFTATAERTAIQEDTCLTANLPDLYGCYGDGLNRSLKAFGDYMATFPRVWEPNVIASFDFNTRRFSGLSFNRASTGTYIYGNSGYLLTAAVDVPRYESNGLLLEPASANITRPSEAWVASSGATGGNAYTTTAADNAGWCTVTGGTDTGRSDGSFRVLSSGAAIQNQTATMSIDVKKVAGYRFRVRVYAGGSGSDGLGDTDSSFVDGQAPVIGAGMVVLDYGSWYRIYVTRKFGDGASIFRLYPFGNEITASGSLTYRRAQVELINLPTSYLATTTAIVSRAADILTLTSSGTPKRVYREYTPLGSTTPVTETVPYTGVLCPPGNVRVIKVLND